MLTGRMLTQQRTANGSSCAELSVQQCWILANVSLFGKDVESSMTNCHKSKMQIEVANSQLMDGRSDGTLHMCILDNDHSSRDGAVFHHQVTTVDNLSRELFSIDDLFSQHGLNVLLRQPDF